MHVSGTRLGKALDHDMSGVPSLVTGAITNVAQLDFEIPAEPEADLPSMTIYNLPVAVGPILLKVIDGANADQYAAFLSFRITGFEATGESKSPIKWTLTASGSLAGPANPPPGSQYTVSNLQAEVYAGNCDDELAPDNTYYMVCGNQTSLVDQEAQFNLGGQNLAVGNCPTELINQFVDGDAVSWKDNTLRVGQATPLPCVATNPHANDSGDQVMLCGAKVEGIAANSCTWTASAMASPAAGAGGTLIHFWINGVANEGCPTRYCSAGLPPR